MGIRFKISNYRPSIFQSRLDFSARRGISLSLEHPYEQLLLRVCLFALIVLACGYLYLVTSSVLNVMARKEAQAQTEKIQGDLGGLEQQYYALSQSITPEKAVALGLVPVAGTAYVYRPGTVGAVAIARKEI
jgi:hypothetical protein